ncbi:MAG: hypothetical protein ABIH38_02605 [Patescibacteria group bacterium]
MKSRKSRKLTRRRVRTQKGWVIVPQPGDVIRATNVRKDPVLYPEGMTLDVIVVSIKYFKDKECLVQANDEETAGSTHSFALNFKTGVWETQGHGRPFAGWKFSIIGTLLVPSILPLRPHEIGVEMGDGD